ncbi:MAG: D-alanyl-D-alanine carboxypeptidase [Acidimicrobiia bacterium]|nr:D-alanyl-D-alanine carboxypeptidase [Acidimicrobiia bacterium]
MGGGRLSWAVRALGVLIAVEVVASGAVLVVRSSSSRSAALVRALPAPNTTTSVAPDPTTFPPPPPASPPAAPVPTPPSTQPATSGAAARLTARLEAALGGVPSCLVVDDGATPVYVRGLTLPLAPASTQKLLVASAALDRLGPDYRFETTVVAPAPPAADGSVDALWLVGAGDPLLSTPEYAAHLASDPRTVGTPATPMSALVDQLAAAGVHAVRNGIHGDNSRYDGPGWLPGWKPIYRDEADVGVLSALTVNGGLDHWEPTEVISPDPTSLAGAQLARLLAGRGISAAGAASSTRPGSGVVLARVTSAPLSDIVAAMLRSSDNLAAELLVREIDKQAGGTGTTDGGLARVADAVASLGIPTIGLHMSDGSGLDPADRATCPALLAALDMGDRPGFTALATGLAVAARTGTLATRFGGTPLAGHLSAKTGWINCAAAMVGRLDLTAPLHFALIVNGPCDWNSAEAYENRVAMALATYPT